MKILKNRTHTCGELNENSINQAIILNGWISKVRDLGSVIFADLRDRYGKTQLVFNADIDLDAFNSAKKLSLEDVIGIEGKVVSRPDNAKNTKIITGGIDIEVTSLVIYNKSLTPPFDINDRQSAMEDHRLKFRYLELRTKELQHNLKIRHKAAILTRNFLSNENFIEIETPILMKSTPEGARDFLVPSRLHKGKFYALPQSPQTYKQLLMVSGFDRYFQIVKCFRDEDFRADRQPEFTQIDIEMSFINESDIISLGTNLVQYIWKEILDVDLENKFPVLSYKDAMENYGSDKPDLRFDMKLLDFNSYIQDSDFNTFKDVINNGGIVKGIICPNAENYSRKVIDELTNSMKTYYGAKGLAWFKVNSNKFDGGIGRFFNEKTQQEIIDNHNISNNSIIFLIGDTRKITLHAMGALRLKLGEKEKLIQKNNWAPLWIVDFPLFEKDEKQDRLIPLHHPFTSPKSEDIDLLQTNPENIRSVAYDIVMNGYELGGGSIRIHDSDTQKKIFDILGISDIEAEEKFGFLMNAFKYGAPPHGGMAFGFDRIVMLLAGSNQIRDVIAFPKTTSATSLMDNSPSNVDSHQLDELGLNIKTD
ncbi:aspartate--tRNA ligase [bacterium]|nr:aspartate--tRNA ligase [bacterium]